MSYQQLMQDRILQAEISLRTQIIVASQLYSYSYMYAHCVTWGPITSYIYSYCSYAKTVQLQYCRLICLARYVVYIAIYVELIFLRYIQNINLVLLTCCIFTNSDTHALVHFECENSSSIVPLKRVERQDGLCDGNLCSVIWSNNKKYPGILICSGSYASQLHS